MASLNPTTVPSKRLAASITGASSSFQLNNIEGWDGNDLTASDFGTKAYGVFRNDANTLMELFEFDPSTIASGSITILRRGLKFTGDLTTEVSANKLSWIKNETIVDIGADVPQLLKHYVDDISDQSIGGTKTFTAVPATSGGDPVGNNDLARKSYIDNIVLGTLTTINVVVPAKAGATIANGDLVYFDETDNEWKLCDADTAATVDNVLLGIAQGAGTDGNPITGGVLLQGVDDAQSGMTEGDVMYASNTAGDISSSAGTNEVTVGIAKSATELYFNPRFNQQITEAQQDALNATTTPSSTNLFLTQKDFQKGAEIYAADAEASDTYVITLSPAPSAYAAGMTLHFKANTANTGAATLNVNSLGAKTIKKNYNADLATGDIKAGQIVCVIYDGTNFQLLSPTSLGPSLVAGNTTKDISVNTTTTIAHGLGVTPRLVRVSGAVSGSGAASSYSVLYDSTQSSWSMFADTGTGTTESHSATFRLQSSDTAYIVGTITVDSTNITITWVVTGSPSGTANLVWEAFA